MQKKDVLKLPPLWLERWKTGHPFWHVFHLQGEIFREQPGRKTLRFIEEDTPYFLKCHFGVGWKEIFKNLVQGRLPVIGAQNEVAAIERLAPLGFVPTLVGYGWQGSNPARQRSFIITKELSCTTNLEEFCRDWPQHPPPPKLKWGLIRKIAEITKKMHDNGVNHRDYYLCHFLLDTLGGTEWLTADNLSLFVIDWHRAQVRNKVPKRWRMKDLAALYFSAMELELTQRDLYRFIKYYGGHYSRHFWQRIEIQAKKLYRKVWRKLAAPQPLPFFLHDTQGEKFYLQQSLRKIPRKRWTVLAQWRQQPVVAKLFASQRHAQRELRNYRQLTQKNILTPELLHHGWIQEKAAYILIYRYYAQDINLAELFRGKDIEKQKTWFNRVLEVLKHHHQQGIQQCDLHWDNFLVHHNQIYTLDLGQVRYQSRPLSTKNRLKNTALLIAQLNITQQKYCVDSSADHPALHRWIKYWHSYRANKYTIELPSQDNYPQTSECTVIKSKDSLYAA